MLAATTLLGGTVTDAGGTLRLGMTAADIPTAKGAPDEGAEGIRWMGFTIYDSLLYWDLNQEERIPKIIPTLAEKYYVGPEDATECIFELRKDVKFHDRTLVNQRALPHKPGSRSP